MQIIDVWAPEDMHYAQNWERHPESALVETELDKFLTYPTKPFAVYCNDLECRFR